LAFSATLACITLNARTRIRLTSAIHAAFAHKTGRAILDASQIGGTASLARCTGLGSARVIDALSLEAELTRRAAIAITSRRRADLLETDALSFAIRVIFTRLIAHALAFLASRALWTAHAKAGIFDTAINLAQTPALTSIGNTAIRDTLAISASLTLWTLNARTEVIHALTLLAALALRTKDPHAAIDTASSAADLIGRAILVGTSIIEATSADAELSLWAGIGGAALWGDAASIDAEILCGAILIKDAGRRGDALSRTTDLLCIRASHRKARIGGALVAQGVAETPMLTKVRGLATLHFTTAFDTDLPSRTLNA
jgi:hypothetical protein